MTIALELAAAVDEAERVMLDVAAGLLSREALENWMAAHIVKV